jgi:hypothetical protein
LFVPFPNTHGAFLILEQSSLLWIARHGSSISLLVVPLHIIADQPGYLLIDLDGWLRYFAYRT